MTGIISLLIIISLSMLATRIGALALIHTGLSMEMAKFQARSAYMGVGFTTNESEMVVNNPVRRRILTILMFLGNAGVITTISSVIFSFISVEQSGIFSVEVLVLVSGLLLLFLISQSKWIDKKLSAIINKALKKYTYLDVKDYYNLLHLTENYRVSEIEVEDEAWLLNKRLDQLDLGAEGLIVLGIKRKDGKYLGAPTGQTKVKKEDVLVLYGREKLLESLRRRKNGSTGEKEHKEAVSEQEKLARKQEDDQT